MKKGIILILFVFFCSLVYGQNYNIDSLHQIIKNENAPDSSILFAKIDMAGYHVYRILDSAEIYINEVFDQLNEKDNAVVLPSKYYRHYLVKAWVHQGNNELQKAKELLLKVDKIVQKDWGRDEQVELEMNLASVLVELKDTSALPYVESYIAKIDTSRNKNEKIAWTLGQLYKGRIYHDSGKYYEALSILIKAAKTPFLTEIPDYRYGIFNTLGIILNELRDHDNAIKYYNESLQTPGLFDFEKKYILGNLIEVYFDLNLLDSCKVNMDKYMAYGGFSDYDCFHYYRYEAKFSYLKDDFQNALAAIKKSKACTGNGHEESIMLNAILEARILHSLKRYKESVEVLKIAEKIGNENPGLVKKFERQNSIAFINLSNRLALKSPNLLPYFNNYAKVNKDFRDFEANEKLKELTIAFEAEKKEQENILLKNKELLNTNIIERQRLSIWSAVGAFLLVSVIAFLFFRRSKERTKSNVQLSLKNEEIQNANDLLEEKNKMIETLNGELSHRVKNNLQFVSGLMRMQARRLKNPEAKAAVNEAEHRVEAMSIVHRKLYKGQEHTKIEMYDYLDQLSQNLLDSYAQGDATPEVALDFDPLIIDAEAAVQIGLIINELMTNSFKYAFVDQKNPRILIKLEKANKQEIKLLYHDNGKGIPLTFDLSKTDSLGLRLIHDLTTEQLNGKVEITNQDGAQFKFKFRTLNITA